MSMLDLHSKLGTRLRRIRVKSGLTLTELSIRMRNDRFSASTISQYERGKKAFDMRLILLFCDVLSVRPDYFFRVPVITEITPIHYSPYPY